MVCVTPEASWAQALLTALWWASASASASTARQACRPSKSMQTSQRTPPTRRLLATTKPTIPMRPATVTQDVHFMLDQAYPRHGEKSRERSHPDGARSGTDWDLERRWRRMGPMSTELPPHVTTVLFDVGNTLHHLDHALVAGVVTAAGAPADAASVARAEYAAKAAMDSTFRAGPAAPDAVRQRSYFEVVLETLGLGGEAQVEVLATLHAENRRRSLWRVMHPDTPAVLTALAGRGLVLGVVSNADGRVPAALEAYGIASLFRVIVDSHLVGVEKPDPRIFALALDACGARAEEAVYVGDIYEIDVQGARRAGMFPILLDPQRGYGPVDCARIERLADLLELLPAPR